jgi:hypothetical protein
MRNLSSGQGMPTHSRFRVRMFVDQPYGGLPRQRFEKGRTGPFLRADCVTRLTIGLWAERKADAWSTDR